MLLKWRTFFQIPEEIRAAYEDDSLRKNRISFFVISLIIFVTELFNMSRVLFLSSSGLDTWNNRIYFSFYLSLLISAVVALGLQKIWNHSRKRLSRLYPCMALFWLLWHVLLNTWDLWKNPDSGVIVFITAVIGLAIFVQFHPTFTVFYFILGYTLFLGMNITVLGGGNAVNITITVIVALAVALTRFDHVCKNLLQQQQIMDMHCKMIAEQEKLRLSLEKHKVIMEQANEVMFDWYLQEDVIIFSRNWKEKFGYPEQISAFLKWLQTVDKLQDEDRQTLLSLAQECKNGTAYAERECLLETAQGEREWFLVRVSVQFDSAGNPIEGIGILNSIDKQKKEIALLQSLLKKDNLTGILNKTAVRNYAELYLSQASMQEKVVMFIIDLDNFKGINDTYGHPFGDFILLETACILRQVFRKKDGVGRIGGDEFAVILTGVKDLASIYKKAEQLLTQIAANTWKETELKISCSIGISIAEQPDKSYDILYKETDLALYEAKKRGKNCFCVYST